MAAPARNASAAAAVLLRDNDGPGQGSLFRHEAAQHGQQRRRPRAPRWADHRNSAANSGGSSSTHIASISRRDGDGITIAVLFATQLMKCAIQNAPWTPQPNTLGQAYDQKPGTLLLACNIQKTREVYANFNCTSAALRLVLGRLVSSSANPVYDNESFDMTARCVDHVAAFSWGATECSMLLGFFHNRYGEDRARAHRVLEQGDESTVLVVIDEETSSARAALVRGGRAAAITVDHAENVFGPKELLFDEDDFAVHDKLLRWPTSTQSWRARLYRAWRFRCVRAGLPCARVPKVAAYATVTFDLFGRDVYTSRRCSGLRTVSCRASGSV